MSKTTKTIKTTICPACKSETIDFFIGYEIGLYKCSKCNYVGPIILEKVMTKN